jgi:Transposase DDE domain
VDRVKSYRGTFAYEKALRKRRVWVKPLFGEAKEWHGMRRFRLRRLEKVTIETLLIASGQSIKRLVAARERGPRKLAQAAAGSGESLPASFDRMVAFLRRSKGVFQQADKLRRQYVTS